jgi:hypothetical protein
MIIGIDLGEIGIGFNSIYTTTFWGICDLGLTTSHVVKPKFSNLVVSI